MDLILISIAVSFLNSWIWRMIKADLALGLALISLSVLITYIVKIKFNRNIFFISIILTIIISTKLFITGFDNNLNTLSPDQQKQLSERHGYFSIGLGKLFQNKFTLRFYKGVYPYLNIYGSNMFNSLSPNLYFFANHPREREKVEEFLMYPAILIIPFLIGVIKILNNLGYLIVGYILFALFITGFIKQSYILGPVLFFPLINLLITLGFLEIYKNIKKYDF